MKSPLLALHFTVECSDLTDAYKAFYVTWLFDMWSHASYSEMPGIYTTFRRKMGNITMQQIKAIFDRHLGEHPEEWHFIAASIFDKAIREIIFDN